MSVFVFSRLERAVERVLSPLEHFIHQQSTSGLLLMLTTILALVFANTALAHFYFQLHDIPVSVSFGGWALNKPLILWINDGLMAFFFFVVGLELKRELLFGELASLRKAALPVVAAVGGMVVPALIYYLFNTEGSARSGWAIPMATDIAFAIGVLVLLGSRVPRALMAMLVGIAIIDDLGAISVIALFYTDHLYLPALGYACLVAGLLILMNVAGLRNAVPYFCLAVLLWYAMLKSGVHPTLAGVIGAFTIPARPKYDPDYFSDKSRELLARFETSFKTNPAISKNEQMRDLVVELEQSVHHVSTPAQRLERIWHLPVAYLVIPVFAFFNAGIALTFDQMLAAIHEPVFQGIFFGLLIGKFVGIFGVSWLGVRLRLLALPDGVTFAHVAGMALIAGIGFTMSIFIGSLAFTADARMLTMAKAAIFAASLTAGISGFLVLSRLSAKSA